MPRDEDDYDDRPRRRRRDDDEEDDQPRRRRRDDDDEDDRPRRSRDEEYDRYDDDDDDYAYDREGRRRKLPRETLRAIAGNQRAIILCILIQLCLIPVAIFIPEELRLLVAIIFIPVGIAATVFVFLLATKVYNTAVGVILGVLTLLPCIGLIVLLVINGKATGILRENGVHVGFLGARSSDI